MKKWLWFLCMLCGTVVYAQTDSAVTTEEEVVVKPEINPKLKPGIKLGVGNTMMVGGALQNPVPQYMLNGVAYLSYRFKPHWFFCPELGISFRGGRFDNGDAEYERILTYMLDVPVLLMYGFDEQNTKRIVFGGQYSHTLNASLFKKNGGVAEPGPVGITKHDVLAILGTHFQTPYIGVQILGKYGFIDANNGILSRQTPVDASKGIHHFIIELNLVF